MSQPTEKSIRAALTGPRPQTRFGDTSVCVLLAIIDEQRGTIAMHEANADEAALLAARQLARISELEAGWDANLFEQLARANAFDELKQRDVEKAKRIDELEREPKQCSYCTA